MQPTTLSPQGMPERLTEVEKHPSSITQFRKWEYISNRSAKHIFYIQRWISDALAVEAKAIRIQTLWKMYI